MVRFFPTTGNRRGRCNAAAAIFYTATLLAACAAASSVGCQRGEVLGQVHGRVTSSGRPLTSGTITFSNSAAGVNISANVNDIGEYKVSMARGFGLPLGTYRVAVIPYVPELLEYGKPAPSHDKKEIPERFRRPTTSGLEVTVRQGDNRYDIQMVP
jgi:hypothetical protein